MAKRCERCGRENSDAMSFCLDCGATLQPSVNQPNFGGTGTQPTLNPNTSPYQQSVETAAGSNRGFMPNASQTAQLPPPPRGKSKIFLILGGVFSLFFLVFVAIVAIFIVNLKSKKDVVDSPSPSPTATRIITQNSPAVTPTLPAPPTPPTAENVKFDKIWIDYNVTEKNLPGMRIHNKMTISKMKGTECYLRIDFQKKDGTKLLTNNPDYRNSNGQVSLFSRLIPAFEETAYNDLQLFIPYSELSLTSGKYDLTMDVDLVYKNGDLIQHLTFSDFTFTQP